MEAVPEADVAGDLHYMQYEHALEPQYLPAIRSLISKDLSEPYSIYVYHYFLYNWPHLCFMVSSHPVLSAYRNLALTRTLFFT